MSAAYENGVGVIIAGVYNSGLLAQPRPEPTARYNYETAAPPLITRVDAIADICERHGITVPEAALAFPFRHPAVVSVVVGAENPYQVAEAVGRLARHVPDAAWSDLTSAGLIGGPR
jgi:D-threo-aldose 1-dehydrogenase